MVSRQSKFPQPTLTKEIYAMGTRTSNAERMTETCKGMTLPKLVWRGDSDRFTVPANDDDDSTTLAALETRLSFRQRPLGTTFARVDNSWLLDPTLEEERAALVRKTPTD